MVTYNGDLKSSVSHTCEAPGSEERNETIKNMLDELRELSISNYQGISRIRALFSGTPEIEPEFPDRASISHDILGDLIIQKMIADVLHDIFNGLGV